MQHSEKIDLVCAALVEAQGEMRPVSKDTVNYFKKTYADLLSLWEACRPILHKHGLAVAQFSESSENETLLMTTMLIHKSGQYLSGTMAMPIAKLTLQEIGSAVTYSRRYGLAPMLGLVGSDEDDDGEAVMKRGQNDKAPKPKANAPKVKKAADPERSSIIHADMCAEIANAKTYAVLKVVGGRIARQPLTVADKKSLRSLYEQKAITLSEKT